MQKIIFRASVCHFHDTGCQFHHSNYLKVNKISANPQTVCKTQCGTAFKLNHLASVVPLMQEA